MRRLILLAGTLLAATTVPATSAWAALGASAATGPLSAVSPTGATLTATVTPSTDVVTSCVFDYGTSTAYGSTAPCSPGTPYALTTAVSAAITGLTPGTAYDYQVVIDGVVAGTVNGGNTAFTTPKLPTAGQATSVTGSGATLSGTVNPEGYSVTSCSFQLGTSTSYGTSIPCSPTPTAGGGDQAVSAAASGLAASTPYHFRLVLVTAAGTLAGPDSTFTTLPFGTATTLAPSAVGTTTATLAGTVNPEGVAVVSCAFYYGTGSSLQGSVPCSSTPAATSSDQSVSAVLSGLASNTTYNVLLVLQTAAGYAPGGFVKFTTLKPPPPPPVPPKPTGSTAPATGVSSSVAHLHATVDPHGETVVACLFEFGVSPFDDPNSNAPYTLTVPCSGKFTSSGATVVTATLRRLAAHTLYYYRVLVKTTGGLLVGNARTFRTAKRSSHPVKRHHHRHKRSRH